jgi:hypothetical protein
MRRSLLICLVTLLFLTGLWGCQTTRADYRDDIAESVCDQMQQCNAFGGEDAEFADYDDCMTEVKATYNDMWPADECGNGRIDPTKFNQCKSRAVSKACDENILDALSFRLECGAGDVCVAEPDK